MQWLGISSWSAYEELPADLVDEAIGLMHHEHEEQSRREQHYRNWRGKRGTPPPYSPSPYESPLVAHAKKLAEKAELESEPKPEPPKIVIDEKGRERIVRQRADGTIVKHRQITPGDRTMWMLFGIPKSFRGKVDPEEVYGKGSPKAKLLKEEWKKEAEAEAKAKAKAKAEANGD